jgi:hypothetical protein
VIGLAILILDGQVEKIGSSRREGDGDDVDLDLGSVRSGLKES